MGARLHGLAPNQGDEEGVFHVVECRRLLPKWWDRAAPIRPAGRAPPASALATESTFTSFSPGAAKACGNIPLKNAAGLLCRVVLV